MELNITWPYPLLAGHNATPEKGACAMAAISWLVHGVHSDAPPCVDPFLRGMVINLNDHLGEEERNKALLPLLPRLSGSVPQTFEQQRQRISVAGLLGLRAIMAAVECASSMSSRAADDMGGTLRSLWYKAYPRDSVAQDRARFLGALSVFYELLGDFPGARDACSNLGAYSSIFRDCDACDPAERARAGDKLMQVFICTRFNLTDRGKYEEAVEIDPLKFLLRVLEAGPEGEPWSADQLDVAVNAYKSAGGLVAPVA